jgi:hypothetical protein
MNRSHWLTVLTLLNLGLLACNLARPGEPLAAAADGVLRGRGLEIVDEQGRVRASVQVMPAATSPKGDAYPETVLLRLITERGRPSVKLAAAEPGSGLSFAGPTETKDTWAVLQAKGTTSYLELHSEDGSVQIVKP